MEKRKNSFWKEFWLPFLICFAFTALIFLIIHPPKKTAKFSAVAIVLSPHFDDGVLSLGGMMAESDSPVIVATFFAEKPYKAMRSHWDSLSGFKNSDEAVATRTDENVQAVTHVGAYLLNLKYLDFQYRYERDPASREKILQSVEKDIATMLENFANYEEISIYGPAEFGSAVSHPDHKLLHDAFTAVAREMLGKKNLHFFYFEDFPYVESYNISTTTPLKIFLEQNNPGLALYERRLPLNAAALDKKIKAVKDYGSQNKAFASLGEDIAIHAKTFALNRCKKTEPLWRTACEVVYEIRLKI